MLSLPEVRNFCWMFEEASMGVGLVVKRFGSFFMQVHLMFFFFDMEPRFFSGIMGTL
jgi:hypothetical protein